VVAASNEDEFIDVEGDESMLQQYNRQLDEDLEGQPGVADYEQLDETTSDIHVGGGGIAQGGGYTSAGMEEYQYAPGEFDEHEPFDGNYFFVLNVCFEVKFHPNGYLRNKLWRFH